MSFTNSYVYKLIDEMTPALEAISKKSKDLESQLRKDVANMSKTVDKVAKTALKATEKTQSASSDKVSKKQITEADKIAKKQMADAERVARKQALETERTARKKIVEAERTANREAKIAQSLAEKQKKAMEFARSGAGITASGRRISSAGKDMMLGAGTIIAPLGLMAKQAMDYSKGLSELSTLMPTKNLKQVKEEFGDMILGISSEFAKGSQDVVKASYQAVSAGVAPTRKAVEEFLRVSAEASVGGVTGMETAVDGITSVLNAYGPAVMSATEISDKMFTAVRLGKTTFEELSGSLFNVIPSASAIGVKFGDITGALAVMTAKGTPTTIATTQLRAMLQELSKSGTLVSKVFKKVSGESFNDFIQKGGNVQQALALINSHADKNKKKMVDIFGSIEAGQGALALSGKNAQAYSMALDEMTNSANATSEASKKMMEDEGFKADQAMQKIKNMSIEIGTNLLPVIADLTQTVTPLLSRMSNWIKNNKELLGSVLKVAFYVGSFVFILGLTVTVVGWVVKAVGGLMIATSWLGKTALWAKIETMGLSTSLKFLGKVSKLQAGIIALGVVSWMMVLSELADKTSQAGTDMRVGVDSIEGFFAQLKKLAGFLQYIGAVINPFSDSTETAQRWGAEVAKVDDYAMKNKIGMYEKELNAIKQEINLPKIEPRKNQKVDVNVSNDVGGLIKIDVDSKGKATVKQSNLNNPNLGFQVN
jgi:TP901 family phage tail tape measure protein